MADQELIEIAVGAEEGDDTVVELPGEEGAAASEALRELVARGYAKVTRRRRDSAVVISLIGEPAAQCTALFRWAWLREQKQEEAESLWAASVEATLVSSSAARVAKLSGWPCPEEGLASLIASRGLVTTLRPYQLAALAWMRRREEKDTVPLEPVDAGWLRVGPSVWWNCVSGLVRSEKPTASDGSLPNSSAPGGILADEMGLGKTLVVLSLALCRRRRLKEAARVIPCSSAKRASPLFDAVCLCGGSAVSLPVKKRVVYCTSCGRGLHEDCILHEEDPFVCVCCEIGAATRRLHEQSGDTSGGTLVVAPRAILSQWCSEAARHAPTLRIGVYEGVRALTNPRANKATRAQRLAQLSPLYLNNFDLVLTTYDVLTTDLAHASDYSRRSTGKYAFVPSPLLAVCWERVCLDEAQLCESSTAACAQLALRIPALSRWAVTGTPVGRGASPLEDLYGLAAFVRIQPWQEKAWWRGGLNGDSNFERRRSSVLLRRLAGRYVWRATKALVGDEMLGLPSLTASERRLDFTDEERFFYDKQLEAATAQVKHCLLQQSKRKQKDDDEEESTAMFGPPLLRVRQACCHPSVGANDRHFLTLDQVLSRLAMEARLKYEEQHRIALLHRCAVAALALCEAEDGASHRNTEAAAHYLAALREIDSHRRPLELLGSLDLITGSADLKECELRRGRTTRLEWKASTEEASWARLELGGETDRSANRRLVALELSLVDKGAVLKLAIQAMREGSFETFLTAELGGSTPVLRLDCLERLRVLRFLVISAAGERAVDVRIFEAEVDTDGYQELHAAFNLERALTTLDGGEAEEEEISDPAYAAARAELAVCDGHGIDRIVGDAKRRVTAIVAKELRTVTALWNRESLALDEATRAVDSSTGGTGWWREALRVARPDEIERCVLQACESADDTTTKTTATDVARWLGDLGSLEGRLTAHRQEALRRRRLIIAKAEALSSKPDDAEQLDNSQCYKCREDFHQKGPKCKHCYFEDAIGEYAATLNSMSSSQSSCSMTTVLEALTSVTRAAARRDPMLSGVMGGAERDATLRSALLKELGAIRRLWRRHFNLLSELDSLRQSRTTMQLFRGPPSDLHLMEPELRAMHVIPALLAERKAESHGSLVLALDDLRTARSGFKHLLRRVDANDDDHHEAAEEDETASWCAICHESSEVERAVLTLCGHSFCARCVRDVAKSSGNSTGLRCPTCRQWHKIEDEVAFPLAMRHAPATSRQVRTYGTKVAALAEDVASLPPGEKCLVFAEWDSMLQIVSHALTSLGVGHERPRGRRDWDEKIGSFRTSTDIRALLLNVKTAAAGLTLVEANHVLLLHPLLSSASEAQAVGRVHRIGQTRPITVKRYLVNDTVEAALHNIATKRAAAAAAPTSPAAALSPASPSKKRRRPTGAAAKAATEALHSRSDLNALFDLNALS